MAVFRYEAINQSGDVEVGRIEAASEQLAAEELVRKSLVPLQLMVSHGLPVLERYWRPVGRSSKPRRQDIVLLTQELAALLRAGLTLDRALTIAAQLVESLPLQRLIEDLSEQVRRGASFAEALEKHKNVLPGYYISMVRAGEVGGALPDVMVRLSQLLTRAQQMRDSVTSALIYPSILLGMIGLTLVLILTFVLPRFEMLFADSGAQLPWPTKVVIGLGGFVKSYGWLIMAIGCLGLVWFSRAWRSPDNRLRLDGWVLRRRLIGTVVAKVEAARFARTLSTLLGGGLPVPSALLIAHGSLYNTALREAGERVHRGVVEGESCADQLAKTKVFPALLIHMARVGEETGQLHVSLAEAADMLDAEAQRTIERGLALLVPAITVIMGFLVAALIGSVLVGILSVNDLAF